MADAYIEAQRRIDRGESPGQIDISYTPEQLKSMQAFMGGPTIKERKRMLGLYKELDKMMKETERIKEEIVGLKKDLSK